MWMVVCSLKQALFFAGIVTSNSVSMRRETKYTLAGFAVFVYSLGLMALLMISFYSSAGPTEKGIAALITLLAGCFWALMIHFHPKNVHFRKRAILLLMIATLTDVLIWIMICEGSFVPLA
jgi:hypothetical protein